jgi:hypothetical protein
MKGGSPASVAAGAAPATFERPWPASGADGAPPAAAAAYTAGAADIDPASDDAMDLVTGAELEALLAQIDMPMRIMVRPSEAPTSEANAYYRAEVLAVDRADRRMQLRYQHYGDRAPFWLPVTSARLWRGCYPLSEDVWTNLGKVRMVWGGEGGVWRAWHGRPRPAARTQGVEVQRFLWFGAVAAAAAASGQRAGGGFVW